MIRLYFNQHGDKPWSIDRGFDTPETICKYVSVDAPGECMYKPDAQDGVKAWVQFNAAVLQISQNDNYCFIRKI